nr:hypothetical protein [Tanacetum cinerariifolium]
MMKKSSSEPCCSKDYRKNTESLNNKMDELKNDLYEANIYRHSYKLGIDQLERKLAEYKEREVKYIETIRSFERDKEFNLRKIHKLTNEVETLQEEKDIVDGKLARLIKSSKDLEDIIESQRSENVKEGVGYNAVPPPAANLYHSPEKDLSWTGLPEFADDTVTDYSRPSPTVESTSAEGDKPAERLTTNKAEFVKAAERPTTDKDETVKKPADPSNRHQFHQQHRSINRWTKNHPLEQVIGDPSKPVMTRERLQTDAEVCMYALIVSTIELKNIKKAMLDYSRIESMQDELNQFKRLDVWELVECPVGRNIIKVKWIWKNKTDAENTVIRNKSRLLLELMLPKRSRKNTKCVSAADEELTAAKHKLMLLPLELMLSKRSRKNTKCVNAADEELTAAKHKLMLL